MPAQGTPRRIPTRALLLVPLLFGACEPRRGLVIGVASGESQVWAARLALEHDVAESGPFPSLDTVMVVDVGTRAEQAIEGAEGLVAVAGMVAVVGHANSATSLAAAPVYNGAGVVQVAPTTSSPMYSRAGPFSFRLVPPDDVQGGFLAAHLADRFDEGGRLAVLYVNDDYGRGLRASFLARVDSGRFSIVLDLPHTQEEVDERSVRQAGEALAETQPDAIVWLGRGQTLRAFMPGIHAALDSVTVLGGDAVATGWTPGPGDPLARGVEYAEFVDLEGSAAVRTFRRQLEHRFGVVARGPEVLAYDAMRLLLSGVRAGAGSGEEMRAYLGSLGRERPPFPGLSGPVVFDSLGDVARPYTVQPLRRGAPR